MEKKISIGKRFKLYRRNNGFYILSPSSEVHYSPYYTLLRLNKSCVYKDFLILEGYDCNSILFVSSAFTLSDISNYKKDVVENGILTKE